MNLVGPVRDRVRTLLKIRRPRNPAPAGGKPAVGARLFRDDVRMSVQAGMTDSLWRWLVEEGWREVTFRPDRRRYRDIQSAYVTRLIDSSSDERERILNAAIANATYRPRPLRPGARDSSRF